MHTYTEQLIAAGIWRADDERDPLTDEAAIVDLLAWVVRQLAPLELTIIRLPGPVPYFCPMLKKYAGRHAIEFEPFLSESCQDLDTVGKAVCASALRVPEFKRELDSSEGRD